jgi:hypothetical protein
MLKQSDKIELFDHYEANLGKMTSSSSLKGVSEQEFLVFIYEGQPYEDCTTYVTVGVSDHPLHSRRSHCDERLEYMICAESKYDRKLMVAVLMGLAIRSMESRETVDIHGVWAGEGPVVIGGSPLFEHLYLTNPGHFAAAIDLCEGAVPPIKIVQVIPITSGERAFIEANGWEAFENKLDQQEIDLMGFDSRAEFCDY